MAMCDVPYVPKPAPAVDFVSHIVHNPLAFALCRITHVLQNIRLNNVCTLHVVHTLKFTNRLKRACERGLMRVTVKACACDADCSRCYPANIPRICHFWYPRPR